MKKVRYIKVGRVFLFITFFFIIMPVANPAFNALHSRYCLVQTNWKNLFNKNGITVYSHKAADSDVMALRAAGVLKAPMDQVMEVLRKVEISKEWIPDIYTKITVEDFSDEEAITYSVNKLPWPFARRSLLLHNKLRLDQENKYLVIDVSSVDSEINSIRENNVRASMYCGHISMRPAGTGQTEIELILFVDPKGHIPPWLVNTAQKSLPYDFLKALEEKASQTSYELRPSFKEMLDRLQTLLGN